MARAAKGAALRGLGRFLSTLAGGYAQDRQRREEEATSNRQFGQRVGEMTLRQYMEENSPEYQQKLVKSRQDVEESKARTLDLGAQATLRGAQAGVVDREMAVKESEAVSVSTRAAADKQQQTRLQNQANLEANTVKTTEEWFARLPEWTEKDQLEEAFQQALRARIGGDASVKLWIDEKYKPWNIIQEKAKREKEIQQQEARELGSRAPWETEEIAPPGTPRAIGATAEQLDAAYSVPPVTQFKVTPGAGAAATQDMGATPPAQLSSPSAAAENTAGLDEADIIAVREAAARWGVSFNDARARLESRVGTPR